MYRILAAHHGGVRDRRNQLTHPPYATPELLATRPNEVWSWDVSKLRPGEVDLLLPVRDPRCVQPLHRRLDRAASRDRAAGQGADRAGHRAAADHAQDPDAARRSSGPMRSKPVAFLLADFGVTKTHSRPYTSTDNPYSESNFKTLKYRPEFPARFDSIDHARGHCRAFVDWYNHAHRHSGIGLMTPAAVHHGQAPAASRRPRPGTRSGLRPQPGTVRPQAASTARATDRRLDQQAQGGRRRSLISNAKRLTELDRLRATVSASRSAMSSSHGSRPQRAAANRGGASDRVAVGGDRVQALSLRRSRWVKHPARSEQAHS